MALINDITFLTSDFGEDGEESDTHTYPTSANATKGKKIEKKKNPIPLNFYKNYNELLLKVCLCFSNLACLAWYYYDVAGYIKAQKAKSDVRYYWTFISYHSALIIWAELIFFKLHRNDPSFIKEILLQVGAMVAYPFARFFVEENYGPAYRGPYDPLMTNVSGTQLSVGLIIFALVNACLVRFITYYKYDFFFRYCEKKMEEERQQIEDFHKDLKARGVETSHLKTE
eukprot:CAMPEP_0115028644 /NCGR_PEP_ID=MMETSP0216-20121206/36454_1 /TAXON_ID=223996 /ORGANISM="Protocruzia adherens, Strain Boccale" /LENGTH=227 /DNA_ID=CAMNT_0002404929 /DNA_START=242 /DNA_END=925 /DNA_ORIENTATION=-